VADEHGSHRIAEIAQHCFNGFEIQAAGQPRIGVHLHAEPVSDAVGGL
jgi:hypothetical protein